MTKLKSIAKQSITLSTLVIGVAFAAGCTDVVVEACERLDECNLTNQGTSVDDCVDILDEQLENASSSERSGWRSDMRECLRDDTCQEFARCVVKNDL